jgi:hypothetical protein
MSQLIPFTSVQDHKARRNMSSEELSMLQPNSRKTEIQITIQ